MESWRPARSNYQDLVSKNKIGWGCSSEVEGQVGSIPSAEKKQKTKLHVLSEPGKQVSAHQEQGLAGLDLFCMVLAPAN